MSWSLVTQRRDESGQLSSRFIAEGRSLICGLRLKPSPGAASGVLPARQLALSVERCLYQLSVLLQKAVSRKTLSLRLHCITR